jgi:hypothetical protein
MTSGDNNEKENLWILLHRIDFGSCGGGVSGVQEQSINSGGSQQ